MCSFGTFLRNEIKFVVLSNAPVLISSKEMASSNSRKLWASHIAKQADGSGANSGKTKRVRPTTLDAGTPISGTILGVDPSLRGTGLALVKITRGQTPEYLLSQTIKVPSKRPMQDCLYEIAIAIHAITDQFKVDFAAIEETIYVQNFQTAQILGAARGAVLTALALRHIETHNYAPLRIKQSVVGYGRASKEQVIKSVQSQLNLREPLPSDEADACGAALCHGYTYRH